jgi:hypothetical protein
MNIIFSLSFLAGTHLRHLGNRPFILAKNHPATPACFNVISPYDPYGMQRAALGICQSICKSLIQFIPSFSQPLATQGSSAPSPELLSLNYCTLFCGLEGRNRGKDGYELRVTGS